MFGQVHQASICKLRKTEKEDANKKGTCMKKVKPSMSHKIVNGENKNKIS